MIPIGKPILGEEEKKAVLRVLDSGMLTQHQEVASFEKEFAEFIGVKHAIATSNGTTALHAALLANNIGYDDEVITTPFSFIATANAIKMAGATPIFVDIDEKTFNINPDLIETAITKKTKAILPVHLFGQSCNMTKIMKIANKHNLIVIEDACQAHGAEWSGRKTGSFGTGCFSFYPTKNMTTGEGGMITTDDDKVAEKVRKIINHGSDRKYYHSSLGYNYRMTDIAAAIGREQLKKLSSFNLKRKDNAQKLNDGLKYINGMVLPKSNNPGIDNVYHQYTIKITSDFSRSREEFINLLFEKGISSSIFYPVPIHKQPSYSEYNYLSFPEAEKASKEVLSLPVHQSLTDEDLNFIITTIKDLQYNGKR